MVQDRWGREGGATPLGSAAGFVTIFKPFISPIGQNVRISIMTSYEVIEHMRIKARMTSGTVRNSVSDVKGFFFTSSFSILLFFYRL